jgi:hypothetical protein
MEGLWLLVDLPEIHKWPFSRARSRNPGSTWSGGSFRKIMPTINSPSFHRRMQLQLPAKRWGLRSFRPTDSRSVPHPSSEESHLGAPAVLHPTRTRLRRQHLPIACWSPRPAVGSLRSMPSSPAAAWSSTRSGGQDCGDRMSWAPGHAPFRILICAPFGRKVAENIVVIREGQNDHSWPDRRRDGATFEVRAGRSGLAFFSPEASWGWV